jgi:hypothetical protein
VSYRLPESFPPSRSYRLTGGFRLSDSYQLAGQGGLSYRLAGALNATRTMSG